jgi:preprotein translocase subunit Sec63
MTPITLRFVRYCFHGSRYTVEASCTCEPCGVKRENFRRKRRRFYFTPSFCLRLAALGVGWLIIFRYSQRIHSSRQEIQIWDPHHILGVSSYSSIANIKHQYKRLSLKYHPDKRLNGVSKDRAEELFTELTKAYKACVFRQLKLTLG